MSLISMLQNARRRRKPIGSKSLVTTRMQRMLTRRKVRSPSLPNNQRLLLQHPSALAEQAMVLGKEESAQIASSNVWAWVWGDLDLDKLEAPRRLLLPKRWAALDQ